MNKIFFDGLKDFFYRCDLFFLVVLVLLVNFPYIDRSYLPIHDTKCYFELFYFFYNQMFFGHGLAQWMPFEPFGLAASLKQLHALGPFNYLAMAVGVLFQVKDVLIVYKCSIILEQLFLLFGMYKLSRYLFKERSVAVFVCLALLNGFSSWGEQACFHLRVFDMLPMTIYTFVLFFDKRKAYYLWLTSSLFCLWLTGSSFYPAAIWVFIFLILGAGLWLADRRSWKGAFSSTAGIYWFGLSVILLAACVCLVGDFKNGFDLQERAQSGILPINNFLVHGGQSRSLQGFFADLFNTKVPEYYLGLMPVFFFVWSVLRVRNKRYYAFLMTTLALLALSFQGVLSVLFYFSPGMFIYHHLAFIYGMIKIFFLVCAGFGLEDFCRSALNSKIKYTCLIILIGTFFSDATRLSSDRLYSLAFDDATKDHFWGLWLKETNILATTAPLFIFTLLMIVLACISSYLLRKQKSVQSFDRIILFLVFLIVLLNSWQVHSAAHKCFPRVDQALESYLYTVNVHPPEFQDQKTMVFHEGRQKDAFLLAVREKSGVTYTSINDFAQFDLCNSSFRTDAYSKGFNQLMKNLPVLNQDLLNVLGCTAPKIRLISKGIYFASSDEALKEMQTMPEMFSNVVLTGGDPALANKKISENRMSNVYRNIDIKSFSNDELTAELNVLSPTGGWLVYVDSYNPGWRATVDGKETPVYQAYVAFKAVWVDAGEHIVRFFYRNTVVLLCSYLIAICGSIAAAVMIGLLFWQMVSQILGKENNL